MINWILNFFSRKQSRRNMEPPPFANPELTDFRDASLAKFNAGEWDPDFNKAFRSAASEVSKITFFEGHVQHGFALDLLANSELCPRCKAPTQQHYANFIYATNVAPRIMLTPAGYFCKKCPTVIIDEGMVAAGIVGGFHYQGILGLDYEGEGKPDFFRTWNGKDAIYLLDEDGVAKGITTSDKVGQQRTIQRSRKSSTKSRMVKESRKRNRRK